jgi:2-methylcitrate dehydratase PrpD
MAFVAQYAEDRLAEPWLLDVMTRIDVRIDPGIEALGPAFRHAARVAVTTRGGRRLEHEILHRRGSPQNPLQRRDIEHKFRQIVASCLPAARIEQVIQLVSRFETVDSTVELAQLLGHTD